MRTQSREQLLSALDALQAARREPEGATRRQFVRYEVRGDAELAPPDRQSMARGSSVIMLRDLSRGGVGFVSDVPLDKGSFWRVQFHQSGYDVADMNVVIRFCKPVSGDAYLCGAQICVRSGVMCLLGVDPMAMRKDELDTDPADFVAPDQA